MKQLRLAGFQDYTPERMALLTRILRVVTDIFEKWGFKPIKTPAIEALTVLEGNYGEEVDKLIFRIVDSNTTLNELHKATSLHDVTEKGLIYDLTVPFIRYIRDHLHEIKFPFRRYQIQDVWRGERPQRGRFRQFLQCDFDIAGSGPPWSDAEIVSILWECLKALNISEKCTILINHRQILKGMASLLHISESRHVEFFIILDKYDRAGREGVLRLLKESDFDEEVAGAVQNLLTSPAQTISSFARRDPSIQGAIDEIEKISCLVADLFPDVRIEKCYHLARGLAYYTGAIFEVVVEGAPWSIAGGGRYDSLAERICGIKIPAVGASLGVERIIAMLEGSTLSALPAIMVSSAGNAPGYRYVVAQLLRKHGLNVEVFPEEVPLKKQFKYSADRDIPVIIFAGEDEKAKRGITIRWKQGDRFLIKFVPIEKAPDFIKKILGESFPST